MTSTSCSLPSLNQTQNEDLQRLWKSQLRQVVDVNPSAEVDAKNKALSIPVHTRGFIIRLYVFFLDFLQRGSRRDNEKSKDCDSQLEENDSLNSSLRSFADLALSSNEIRLFCGRRDISIHHEDFLTELNNFELKGKSPTDDFLIKDSYGSFMYHKPTQALAAMGSAMALALVTLCRSSNNVSAASINRFVDSSQIIVRFVHLQPQINMVDIKTGLVGKLLTVKGHVVKSSPKRLRVATADFSCPKCGSTIVHCFEKGRYSMPTKCSLESCRSRTFTMIRPTARYINMQELRLQEAQEESTAYSGRTPRQIEVELTHDLVDSCRPGDSVLAACIVQAINSAVAAGRTGKRALETSTYKLYLECHSITTLSERNQSGRQKQGSQVVYSQQQLQSITHLCHADHRYFGFTERMAFPFDLLVRSICPAIIGHHEVKAGILLCLLGGTPPSTQSLDRGSSIRYNSHMLVVGDPGMGKSQMLLAASQLAARCVYVGGNTSSTTGLTVSLTKEERGETGIEAGALVLADQGMCCIDEFDKMAKSHQDGLLEAMEQQQVSIAKAGVVASLPARCSILAAANPKHGSYTMNKTVAENLNLAKPILSRFDLVFILRDRADKGLDRLVSSNIMELYRKSPSTGKQGKRKYAHVNPGLGTDDRMPIWERLAWVADFQEQPLPADLVRDYIAYAREYCKPKLTPEAASVLKDYFMNLRYPPDGKIKDTVPITTRQLEALIRLSQARAKACLRDYVLKGDAEDVVELMSRSVDQVHSDENGALDPGRGGAGGGSNRKKKKAFINEVHRIIGVGAECTLDDFRRIADKLAIGLGDFHPMIEDFRNNGLLMKQGNGKFKILS